MATVSPPPSVSILLAGVTGEGAIRAGQILTRLVARCGFDVLAEPIPAAEFEGETASFRLRVGHEPPVTVGAPADLLVAFDAVSLLHWRSAPRRTGLWLLDADADEIASADAVPSEVVRVPIRRLARDATGSSRSQAWVAAGIAAGLLGLEPELAERFGGELASEDERRRGEPGAALRAGIRFALDALSKKPLRIGDGLRSREVRPESGAAGLVRGLLDGGVRYAAGVPDAACGSLLELLEAELAAAPPVSPQAPRIAATAETPALAASLALGASFGGAASVVVLGSSGAAAAAEVLTAAAAAEVPLVVVQVQAPAGGVRAPSLVEASDLLSTIHAGPASAPRCVLALPAASAARETAWVAVRIAERYQMPVHLLVSRGSLSTLYGRVVTKTDLPPLPRVERLPVAVGSGRFRRYEATPAGTSPMPIAGTPGLGFLATAGDHDAAGHPVGPGAEREAGIRKRMRKLETLRQDLDLDEFLRPAPTDVELEDYEAIAIGWGATRGAVAEGALLAAREGMRTLAIHPVVLHPLPRRLLERVRDRFDDRHVIVFEEGPGGDFARHLRADLGLRAQSVARFDGTPLAPADVLSKLREVFAR